MRRETNCFDIAKDFSSAEQERLGSRMITPAASRLRLTNTLRTVLRKKAGFKDIGIPVIVDNSLGINPNRVAEALRTQGFNARSVTEIFGLDSGDFAILQLAEQLGGRVVAVDNGRLWSSNASRSWQSSFYRFCCYNCGGRIGIMNKVKASFVNNKEHFLSCHQRWMDRRNRKIGSPDYKDEWWSQQCGMCRYFIPLTGAFTNDYGVCSNPSSDFDGMVRFEHDGCDQFSEADDWGS